MCCQSRMLTAARCKEIFRTAGNALRAVAREKRRCGWLGAVLPAGGVDSCRYRRTTAGTFRHGDAKAAVDHEYAGGCKQPEICMQRGVVHCSSCVHDRIRAERAKDDKARRPAPIKP
eukprot:366088-Chlamydomonas_euryale.AAC.4